MPQVIETMSRREEADHRQSARAAKAQAAAAAQRQVEHDRTMALPVDRRGIFDATWSFAGEDFKSKEEAEAARAKLAKSKLEPV